MKKKKHSDKKEKKTVKLKKPEVHVDLQPPLTPSQSPDSEPNKKKKVKKNA